MPNASGAEAFAFQQSLDHVCVGQFKASLGHIAKVVEQAFLAAGRSNNLDARCRKDVLNGHSVYKNGNAPF